MAGREATRQMITLVVLNIKDTGWLSLPESPVSQSVSRKHSLELCFGKGQGALLSEGLCVLF